MDAKRKREKDHELSRETRRLTEDRDSGLYRSRVSTAYVIAIGSSQNWKKRAKKKKKKQKKKKKKNPKKTSEQHGLGKSDGESEMGRPTTGLHSAPDPTEVVDSGGQSSAMMAMCSAKPASAIAIADDSPTTCQSGEK